MKRTLFLVCLILAFATLTFAQDAPKAEIFGGYSYLRADITDISHENFNGWNAALTGNLNKNFGITADISGHYATIGGVGVNSYTFIFGPTISAPMEKIKPFAHALFGVNRLGGGGSSDTSYALAFGGGLDVSLNSTFGIRVAQADYVRTHHFDVGQNNFRLSTGIVINLGK